MRVTRLYVSDERPADFQQERLQSVRRRVELHEQEKRQASAATPAPAPAAAAVDSITSRYARAILAASRPPAPQPDSRRLLIAKASAEYREAKQRNVVLLCGLPAWVSQRLADAGYPRLDKSETAALSGTR